MLQDVCKYAYELYIVLGLICSGCCSCSRLLAVHATGWVRMAE
jgi:hypothetical protein